jgi:hypothetical protein
MGFLRENLGNIFVFIPAIGSLHLPLWVVLFVAGYDF